MLMLGVVSALAGLRLRVQETMLRGTTTLQTALIDATLDGICLTDAEGKMLITNKPLRADAHGAGPAASRARCRNACSLSPTGWPSPSVIESG